jgi:hypothetical protein
MKTEAIRVRVRLVISPQDLPRNLANVSPRRDQRKP